MLEISSVGIIGVGAIGGAIVPHLVQNYEVWIYDVDAAKCERARETGARIADSPAEVAKVTDCSLLFVGNFDQVKAVVTGTNGILDGAENGHIVAIGDTLSPEEVLKIDDAAEHHDVEVVDVPVCREEQAAQAGNLLVLFGGEQRVYDQLEPVLDSYGDVEYMGKLGSGEVAKLANNTLLWTAIAANYEVLSLADEYGLDQDQLRRILATSSGDNYSLRNWEDAYTKWAHADLDAVTAMARHRGEPMPLTGLVSQVTPNLTTEDLDELR